MNEKLNQSNINKALVTFLIFSWVEIILLGNGKWSIIYFGLSYRKIIFTLLSTILVFYIATAKNKKKINYILVSVIPVISWIIWAILVPQLYGTPLEISLAEGAVVIGYSFIPLLIMFFEKNIIEWDYVRIYVYISIITVCIAHLLYALSLINFLPSSDSIIELMNLLLNPEGDTSVNIVSFDSGWIRIGWICSPLMILLYSMPFNYNMSKLSIFILYFITTLALLITGLRGLYMGVFLSFLATLFLRFINRSSLKKIIPRVFIFISIFMISVGITYEISNPHMTEILNIDREGSDIVRYEQGQYLLYEFIDNFTFGKGFGSTVSALDRPDGAQYAFEQYILSLAMKTGIFGIIFLLIFSILINRLIKGDIEKGFNIHFFCLLALFIASSTNPYLFNFVGLFYTSFICIDFMVYKKNGN